MSEALAGILAQLRKSSKRLTPQRRRILDVLLGSHEHLDVEQIRTRASDGGAERVSYDTVYRTMRIGRREALAVAAGSGTEAGSSSASRSSSLARGSAAARGRGSASGGAGATAGLAAGPAGGRALLAEEFTAVWPCPVSSRWRRW